MISITKILTTSQEGDFMQNFKKRQFEKLLFGNGYRHLRTKGSHATYGNATGRIITIPIAGGEINACVAKRLVKEYNLVW